MRWWARESIRHCAADVWCSCESRLGAASRMALRGSMDEIVRGDERGDWNERRIVDDDEWLWKCAERNKWGPMFLRWRLTSDQSEGRSRIRGG